MCQKPLADDDGSRFIVKIEVYAAAGQLTFTRDQIERDSSREMRDLIDAMNRADPNDIEDQTYRRFQLDLCATCQRKYIADPLNPG